MNLAFGLLFSEGDRNYSLGENIETYLVDVGLRPSRGWTEKNIFSVLLPTLCLHGDRLEGGGSVSG
jgi:hypothetical protein